MELNEKTTIPAWAVLASIPTVVAFVFWLSTVANTTNANAQEISDMKKDKKILLQIKEDVAVIRERVDQLRKGK